MDGAALGVVLANATKIRVNDWLKEWMALLWGKMLLSVLAKASRNVLGTGQEFGRRKQSGLRTSANRKRGC